MRKNVLPITAGVLGSLALAVSASADFTGFKTVMKGTYDTAGAFGGPNVGLVDVWNVYANFSSPDDRYVATFVLAGDTEFGEMRHSTDLNVAFDGLGSGFWNWSFGANDPLTGAFYDLDPAAADADTYLTIGLKAGFKGDNAAGFDPDGEGILNASGIMNGNGVINDDFAYFTIPTADQSAPIGGQVLVLQIAVLSGQHASGHWNVQVGTAGADNHQVSAEWTTVPAPGALALLGLAGLAGARRRRRG